jgi:BirA family biotin operon repressor/biotin-[acetyl-CoA-carboxylase] ligase
VYDDDLSRPSLDAAALATLAGWSVEVVEAAGSTNALVGARARSGAPEGLVVVAEHQTAGRGRLDRVWVTPPRAALTFSVLLRPAVTERRWPLLPLLAGLAVLEGVEAEAGLSCRLKWPNDVLHAERKVAGLLVERVETPDGPAAVVGIGLNVSTSADELPVETATSLVAAGAGDVDRTALLGSILSALGLRYRRWSELAGDPRELRADYEQACATIGRRVRVELPSGSLEGTATGVDADGGLVVAGPSGPVTVSAGDVVHVR